MRPVIPSMGRARRQAAEQAAGGWGGLYARADAMAAGAPPNYGIAQDVALQAALYSGNGAAAVGALGAAGPRRRQAFASYQALTSTQREQPICAGIDDGNVLFACLDNDGVVPDAPSIEGFVFNDLSTLGLLTYAGHRTRRRVPAAAAGAAIEEAALSKLLTAGEVRRRVSGRESRFERGGSQSGGTGRARTGERPW